jgi:DNA polymerase-3 subunit alpha
VGVFQFESEGMRRALAQVKPDCFADIVALGALYRPGPMDNIPSFGLRKLGREKVELLHPAMEPILRETHGIIVYQEQVMSLARELAGYSLGEADLLRRAMGKKIHAEMVAQKARFCEGAARNGIDAATADAIFELILKFANYGFNKSHAAAYAVVSYHTAWAKTHHRAEFYAASMAYDIDNTDRLAAFADDARRAGLVVLPPSVNHSEADFTVQDGAVRYALAGLKGVGAKAMEALVAERHARGPFTDIADFARRLDPRGINKRQVESLIAAGALDELHPGRAGVFALAEAIMASAQAAQAERESPQVGLFGEASGLPDHASLTLLVPALSWSAAERMAHEKEAFGFYFSGHPVDGFAAALAANRVVDSGDALSRTAPLGTSRQDIKMAGLLEERRWRTPASGRRYQLLSFSDRAGQFMVSCFDDELQNSIEAWVADPVPLLLGVELQWRDGEDAPRLALRSAQPLADVARRTRQRLVVRLDSPADVAALRGAILAVDRQGGRGRGELVADVTTPDGVVRLVLGRQFLIDADLEAAIANALGADRVEQQALDPPQLALVG